MGGRFRNPGAFTISKLALASIPQKHELLRHPVQRPAGEWHGIGQASEQTTWGPGWGFGVVGGPTEGPTRKRFIKFHVGRATSFRPLFQEAGIQAGEDEKLVSCCELEMKAHPTLGGFEDREEIGGVRDASGGVEKGIARLGADPTRQHPGHVVGEVRVLQTRLKEGMAHDDVEIERGGNLKGRGRIQHRPQHLLQVEDFPQGFRIVPKSDEVSTLVTRREHLGQKGKIRLAEPIPARRHP